MIMTYDVLIRKIGKISKATPFCRNKKKSDIIFEEELMNSELVKSLNFELWSKIRIIVDS